MEYGRADIYIKNFNLKFYILYPVSFLNQPPQWTWEPVKKHCIWCFGTQCMSYKGILITAIQVLGFELSKWRVLGRVARTGFNTNISWYLKPPIFTYQKTNEYHFLIWQSVNKGNMVIWCNEIKIVQCTWKCISQQLVMIAHRTMF